MYGKTFESMYEGSLVGAGFHVWAVWNYIITKTHFSTVELNPRLLAFTLAGSDPDGEQKVREAIEFLCEPDPESRSKEDEGRRLVKEGQFQYRVVNWEKYQAIKDATQLREYNRLKKSEQRDRERAERLAKMTPKQRAAYEKGRAAVKKRPKKIITQREAELNGRSDEVSEAVDRANKNSET